MLVLSREIGEVIDLFVGDVHIEVLPVDIRGNKVRIGVNAPKEPVQVHRREVALQRPELAARIRATEEAKRESA